MSSSSLMKSIRPNLLCRKSLFVTPARAISINKSGYGCPCCFGGESASFCNIHSKNMSTSLATGLYKDIKAFKSLTSDELVEQDPFMRNILLNNKKWIKRKLDADPEYFNNLSKPQTPKYLYFGCSDSRVPANEILGLGPGEVFVQRNVGNLIPGNDLNALSVIEYAVGFLGVTDIIVAGHYGCGAVKAATARQDLGMLENWLRQIRDVYRLHKDYLDDIKDPDQRQNALVELNVIEQCLNIYKTGVVQRKRIQVKNKLMKNVSVNLTEVKDDDLENPPFNENEIYPRIHGLVFNIADGVLKKIPVDFKKRVGPLDHIYGLYSRANPVEN